MPKIARALVGETDEADAFKVLDAIFDGDNKAQGCPVFVDEGLVVLLPSEDGLGMHETLCVEADEVVFAIGGHIDVVSKVSAGWEEFLGEIGEAGAGPLLNHAPAFDATEFGGHLQRGERLDVRELQSDGRCAGSFELEAVPIRVSTRLHFLRRDHTRRSLLDSRWHYRDRSA